MPVTPHHAEAGEQVPLQVNKLWSAKTQLTYKYYSLPMCTPENIVEEKENIGQVGCCTMAATSPSGRTAHNMNLLVPACLIDCSTISEPLRNVIPGFAPQILLGDRIMNSDYDLKLGSDTRCNVLCAKTYGPADIAAFKERIENEYTVNWILDSLPAAVRMYEEDAPEITHYERGFPLGFTASPKGQQHAYLFNHISFVISYHQVRRERERERDKGAELVKLIDKRARANTLHAPPPSSRAGGRQG